MRQIDKEKSSKRAFLKRVKTATLVLLASTFFTLQAFAAPAKEEQVSHSAKNQQEIGGKQQDVQMLIPGGTPFGVRVHTKGVMVFRVEEGSVAQRCGILQGDLILKLDGGEIESALDFSKRMAAFQEGEIYLTVKRGNEQLDIAVKKEQPSFTKEEMRGGLGLYVRDTLAGIGTLTYYDPSSGSFAGLGHGICEGRRGTVIPISSGTVTDVRITSVSKGAAGAPGQLRGVFCPGVKGSVFANKEEGLFGAFQKRMPYEGTPCPVAKKEQIKEGKAVIRCTVTEGAPENYEVQIEKIYGYDRNTKNFLIKVTDERLLERAGGIVQGMSGSPIIQDGRIVGAVTHVLVDDPTAGYGIYIGNMLEAAK